MLRSRLTSPFGVACAAAILLGCVIRARPVVLSDFPLNDGGLFYLMSDELRGAGYRLPTFTEYNAARIPFAYPPFGFYAAAALADVTSLDLVQVVRLLPLVTTCATLVAFLLLARSMMTDRVAIVASVTAFALVPRSFTWLVMGGGLTRAFGFLFTILALHQAYLLFTRRDLRFAVSAGAFTGLTPLSHLGTAPFLAASLVLFFLAYGRHRQGVLGAAIIGALAVVVSAPWWAAVAAEHGFAPFLAAGQTGGSVLSSGRLREVVIGRLARFGVATTGEPLFPIIGVLALFGALAAVRRRSIAIPAWWVMTLAVDVRAGTTYATLPLSLLAGLGVSDVLLPLLTTGRIGARADQPRASQPEASVPTLRRSWSERIREQGFAVAVLGFFVIYGSLGALTRDDDLGTENAYLSSLSRDERDAMRWVAANTPLSSRFLVVPEEGWAADKAAEWFPALARRPSVATVQGREWLPDRSFARYSALHDYALRCGGEDVRCLDRWTDSSGTSFSHVFIPKSPDGACCRQLSSALRADPRYALVFDGPGAEIFLRR